MREPETITKLRKSWVKFRRTYSQIIFPIQVMMWLSILSLVYESIPVIPSLIPWFAFAALLIVGFIALVTVFSRKEWDTHRLDELDMIFSDNHPVIKRLTKIEDKMADIKKELERRR